MYRDPALLELAHGQRCLLRVPGVCCANPDTVVAAHSNSQRHGKGRGIKAEDCYTVWACWTCHAWLDQGGGTREERWAAFSWAWERQVNEWRKIARDITNRPRAVNAARKVLNHLGAMP